MTNRWADRTNFWGLGPEGRRTGLGEADAMLHCLFACTTAKLCGNVCATAALEAREERPKSLTGRMDLWNNREGVRCGRYELDCLDCCAKKLRDGKLWIPRPVYDADLPGSFPVREPSPPPSGSRPTIIPGIPAPLIVPTPPGPSTA
jgi:hypothetical protein